MNALDLIIVVVYALGMLSLGYFFKSQSDASDYFLGGRSFGWFELGLSTMATQLSAISFISAAAFVGLKEGGGLTWLTYEFAVPLAMIFLMVILVPPLYKSGVFSIYGFLEKRFDAPTRLLISLVFQVSRAFATGMMIYTVALVLSAVMEIPQSQTILLTGIVTVIYSVFGGMKAVVWGDVIQMIILTAGIVVCALFGLHLLGGWDAFLAKVDPARLETVNFQATGIASDPGEKANEFGFWPMLIGGFFLYVSYYGTDQSQAQRTLSGRNLGQVRRALMLNGLIRFPITLAYCFMGLIIGTFAMQTPAFMERLDTFAKPDYMVPVFIIDYLPHGLIGLLIVAILAAAMSSLSSAVNSLSAATVEDFISKLRKDKMSDATHLRVSKWTTVFWGAVCLALAFVGGGIADTVIEAINKIGSVAFGPILATFMLAILSKRVTSAGAKAGLIAGVALNIFLWLGVGQQLFWFWWNATGALMTLGTGLLVSLFTGPAKTSPPDATDQVWLSRENILLVVYFIIIVLFSVGLASWLT